MLCHGGWEALVTPGPKMSQYSIIPRLRQPRLGQKYEAMSQVLYLLLIEHGRIIASVLSGDFLTGDAITDLNCIKMSQSVKTNFVHETAEMNCDISRFQYT